MSERFLFESKFWKVLLNEDQRYLGRSVIILKRTCPSLSELNSQERQDFYKNIVPKIEKVMKSAFSATSFNRTCMMNSEYKKAVPNPSVHRHLRPRYNKEIRFATQIFQDLEFASHYNIQKNIVSTPILKKIQEEVQKYL